MTLVILRVTAEELAEHCTPRISANDKEQYSSAPPPLKSHTCSVINKSNLCDAGREAEAEERDDIAAETMSLRRFLLVLSMPTLAIMNKYQCKCTFETTPS